MGGEAVERGRFFIRVLGELSVDHPEAEVQGSLSPGKQRAVSVLVAGGPLGVTADDFVELTTEGGAPRSSDAALRMSIARLRKHLPDAALPEAVGGRYKLMLPSDAVDAWRLAELSKGPLETVSVDELAHLLSPSEPYPGIDGLDLVDRSRREIQANQRELLARLGRESHQLLAGPFQPLLDAHLELNPSNENLISLTARSLAQSGDRRRALDVLAQARARFGEAGLDIGEDLVSLERQILSGESLSSAGESLSSARSGPSQRARRGLPNPLATLLTDERIGSDDDLDRVERLLDDESGTTAVLLGGESGVGKTRFCADLASRAIDRALPVLYLMPTGPDGGSFAPLIAALPEFRARASAVLAQGLEPSLRKAGLWSAAQEAIAAEASGGPLLIIVDDAHEHDSQTAELIGHLGCSTSDETVLLVVVGRTDLRHGEDAWHKLSTTLRRGAPTIDVVLRPLDEAAMVDLVELRRPGLSKPLVYQVARELIFSTRGLPGVATLALANLDETDLLPKMTSLSSDRLLRAVVDQLSPIAQRVGVIASLIGPQFTVEAVERISGLSEIEVLDAIDELVYRQLVIEQSTVEFTIAHLLVAATLIDRALHAQRLYWHQEAAAYFASDLHRRAGHLADAVPRVSSSLAVEALVHSAAARLEEGLHWEAVRSYRRALVLNGGRLEPADAGRLARALDLSGLRNDAERVRANAFAAAIDNGDHHLALQIATSGFPEGEPFGGDQRVVDRLRTIDRDSLDRTSRFDLACHLSRQLAILGASTTALDEANRAQELAQTPSERVRAALVKRHAISATVPPQDRIQLLAAVADDAATLDGEGRADVIVLRMLDLCQAGRLDDAAIVREELNRLPGLIPPVRAWHAQLFDALIAVDRGELTEGARLRSEALWLARRFGIHEAENGHQVAENLVAWLTGRPAPSLQHPEGRIIDDRSPMADAGRARLLAQAGREAEAIELARKTAGQVLEPRYSDSAVTLALLSPLLRRSDDQQMITSARDLLTDHGQAMLIVGAFVASIGPIHRFLANLAPNETERHELLRNALEMAEATGSRLWTARAHRDLAKATGRDLHRQALADLVGGSELSALALD